MLVFDSYNSIQICSLFISVPFRPWFQCICNFAFELTSQIDASYFFSEIKMKALFELFSLA